MEERIDTMAYTVPTCDCGEVLLFSTISSQDKFYKIKANGAPSKKSIKSINGEVEFSNLYCESCKTTYAIDSFPEEPIIRGNVIS